MTTKGSLRIIGFNIKGYKRIEAFDAMIDEAGLITIGGENANGKTGVIDALESALVGPNRSTTNPVNDGADGAAIRILLGHGNEVEYKVLRKFTKEGKPALVVLNANGDEEPGGGATILKELIGNGSTDPIAWLGMQPKAQRDVLAKLVGLDVTSFDNQIDTARAKQRELEENQKRVIARVDELPWYDDAPAAEVSAAELTQQLNAAQAHNATGSTLKANKDGAENRLSYAVSAAQQAEQEVLALEAQLATKREQAANAKRLVEQVQTEVTTAGLALAEFQPMETDSIAKQIDELDAINQKVRANAAKVRAKEEWSKAELDVAEQIALVNRLQTEKKRALSEAKFPVPDLSFDANQIIYQGQPFAQASQAEQIRVATAICIALRGKVCPIFIREASLLDKKSLRIIAEMAEQHGVQVIAEIVANQEDDGTFDKDCTFYVVDGKRADVEAKSQGDAA